MSRANERPNVWSASPWLRATTAEVVEDDRVLYVVAGELVEVEPELVDIGSTFESFTGLLDADDTSATLARFVSEVGWPELCTHGKPIQHGGSVETCGGWVVDGLDALRVRDVIAAAEAMRSVVEMATRIRRNQKWSPSLYRAAQVWTGSHGFMRGDKNDRGLGAEYLAQWMTYLLHDSGVRPLVAWSLPGRPEVTYLADGLVGALAIETVRRAGLDDARGYRCELCGQPVYPARAPKSGEPCYCKSVPCQRERKRRNQSASRARAKGITS